MISARVLEEPGRWRIAGVAAGLLSALVPALFLTATVVLRWHDPGVAGIEAPFLRALLRSLVMAFLVAVIAAGAGLPLGVLAAIFDFPLRRPLLSLLPLPLLLPTFLWAIGNSMLRRAFGLPAGGPLAAAGGCLLTFTAFALPLVVLTTLVSVQGLTRSQIDSALLAGGPRCVFWRACGSALPVALLSGGLAGLMTLSDPGPSQIFGYPGVASELLVSFSAQYNYTLSLRQCLLLAGVVLVFGLPVTARLARHLVEGALGREAAGFQRGRDPRAGPWISWLFLVVVGITLVPPLLGFTAPAFTPGSSGGRAWAEGWRTLGDTLYYALFSGLAAMAMGFTVAICGGRSRKMRQVLLAGVLFIFALPPTLTALGTLVMAAKAPAALDVVFRERPAVCLALAAHLFPVATVIGMRAFGATSPAWGEAAALHGVALSTFLRRVLFPHLVRPAGIACLLTALLALGDVGTVLLLHPPGADSLPLVIFTVMANAPEALVSRLCLLYVGGAAVLLAGGTALFSRWLPRR